MTPANGFQIDGSEAVRHMRSYAEFLLALILPYSERVTIFSYTAFRFVFSSIFCRAYCWMTKRGITISSRIAIEFLDTGSSSINSVYPEPKTNPHLRPAGKDADPSANWCLRTICFGVCSSVMHAGYCAIQPVGIPVRHGAQSGIAQADGAG